MRTLTSILATLLLATAATAHPLGAQRGAMYIVGGGPQTPEMVQEFVTLAGGSGRARIIVMAMASARGESSGESKANDLRALGATAHNLWVDQAGADLDRVAALLDGATGIWFGGGSQTRLAEVLRGSALERAIRTRFAAGTVVGGTSAGAAVLSALMITGDERRLGGTRPPSDSSVAFITIDRDNIVLEPGLGLVDNAIIDQHFLRRRRHNRLVSVVLERAPHLGVGIDESTALVVEPSGRWRVSGESVAVVYDARRADRTTAAASVLGATGVSMHVLPAGATFDPATGIATLP